MSKEIRGFTKDQLEVILDVLNEKNEGEKIIEDLISKIDKQLKEWNGVKDVK